MSIHNFIHKKKSFIYALIIIIIITLIMLPQKKENILDINFFLKMSISDLHKWENQECLNKKLNIIKTNYDIEQAKENIIYNIDDKKVVHIYFYLPNSYYTLSAKTILHSIGIENAVISNKKPWVFHRMKIFFRSENKLIIPFFLYQKDTYLTWHGNIEYNIKDKSVSVEFHRTITKEEEKLSY